MSEFSESTAAAMAPAVVWRHFARLCAIPRPSKGEAALREHLRQWALGRGLGAEVDAAGNLLLRKPASPGGETLPVVALQAHLDMVCQANAGTAHDFSRDPVRARLRDGWLVADDTTLGADNGIGVALMLALLESTDLRHGPLEALFTVDEEAGMGGARGLAPGWLQARYLLNLDTEAWGEFFLGCAGGLDVDVERAHAPVAVAEGAECFRLRLAGLRGGHSGVDIHEERGNAVKLLVRVLTAELGDGQLLALHGGTARNAIPREAEAAIALPAARAGEFAAAVQSWQEELRAAFGGIETGLQLELAAVDRAPPGLALDPASQAVWLHSLNAAPCGVWRMSRQVPGVVETSNNLGVVSLTPAAGRANFMIRSLRPDGARALAGEIASLFALSGSTVTRSGEYPGWTPNPDSPLLALCQRVYRQHTGDEAAVRVIHAGLECGLLADKYPGLDIVSLGPTIRGAHAPGEAVEVASVARIWELLGRLLASMGELA